MRLEQLGLILCIAFGAFILWKWRRGDGDRIAEEDAERRRSEWLSQHRLNLAKREDSAVHSATAQSPLITEPSLEQLDQLRVALRNLALPTLILSAAPDDPVVAGGTRIGGPVWLPDGAEWPTGRDGRPLEFIAQLTFAAMPPLPDYPEAGLLQLFIGRDDDFGVNSDQPEQGNFRLIWHCDGLRGGRMVQPPSLPKYGSPEDDGYSATPFVNDSVRQHGIGLCARREHRLPMGLTWPAERLLRDLGIDGRAESVDAIIEEILVEPDNAHYVGGHPAFTQNDYRLTGYDFTDANPQPSRHHDVDRVLFQLTSDNGLQWGDMGEANVMVRREDLLARRFDRAIWWWDCY
jgi:uncharacterized protein YwqG